MSHLPSDVASVLSTEEFSFIEALNLNPKPFHNEPFTTEPYAAARHHLPSVPESPLSPAFPPKTLTSKPSSPKLREHTKSPVEASKPPLPKVPTMTGVTKAQRSCLELCLKTTKLGDRVSVRMLEYLTSKDPSPRLDTLAHGFLDTCQILFTIEAGLEESERNHQGFPAEIVTELDKKFRVTQADFQQLETMISKSIDYERKGAMGRMRRGWGKMWGEGDYDKMIASLERTRESLRMSALMFQWSLGDDKINNEMGIGFTALAAALDRLDNKRAGSSAKSLHSSPSHPQLPGSVPRPQDVTQLPLPPLPFSERGGSSVQEPSTISSLHSAEPRAVNPRYMSGNTFISNSSNHSYMPHTPFSTNGFDRHMADETASNAGTAISDAMSDNLLEEILGPDQDPSKPVRIQADPSAMPRWAPRGAGSGGESGNMKMSIVSAIRSKNHKLLSNILDQGVSPSASVNHHPLKEAVFVGDSESVRLLLVFGADANEVDGQGMTALATAVDRGFFAGAAMLLKYGANPNYSASPDAETPLAAAVMANRVNLTHLLLAYGGDTKHLTADGNTLLIAGINKKTPKKFVDMLLEYGADPNAKSREGKTALFEAITSSRADIVTSLIDHGANPNLPGPKHMLWPSTYHSPCLQVLLSHGADFKKTPGIMELAASINNIESVRMLLKAGVDPNAKKDGVYTPLCTSIRDDRPDIFRLLLSNGADPNVPASEYPAFKCITHDRVHFLPELLAAGVDLHSPKGIVETAVAFNNMEALNWLLDQGMNPNERNPKGESPLTTAIRENRMDMVETLLARGADPNMRGEDWPVCMAVRQPAILRRILSALTEPRAFKGVMEMAVVADQLESVKLLLAAGVSVEDKNGGVFSPLTSALRENRREIVVFLLNEGGADVNSPGEHLPIVKALRRFRGQGTEMLELLLDKGADPNKVYRGWNGMMQAVENGDADVLQLLCDRVGVDLEVKDELGRTVTEIAASRGWEEAVAILIKGRLRS
ncbi:ankyrin repeat-containing domain protein [Stachybotrys elegans]|uniref:Ankyrin repeat-containing domain protein n=1 Tax=Stachybotrys elegans TaxID=80388 RepID=A0A8K0WPG2_9HYPO|nr:ankyrin repeat-containing domain protein [Stachybotrys elegans]